MGRLRTRILVLGFTATLVAPSAPANAAGVESLRPGGPPSVGSLMVLAGNLHDHSTDSDGDTASSKVARWFKANHGRLGLDFETLTDHSDFFPLAPLGPVTKPVWKRQGDLAKQLTGDGFSLLRGFEWTNDQQNHINVIGSQNWTSRVTTGDAALDMEPFWTWLSTRPVRDPTGAGLGFGGADGLGQFNHPSEKGVLNWDDYKLHAGAAKAMATIEIQGNRSKNAHDLMSSDAGWYWLALAKGWTVSPVMNFDFHDWQGDGVTANAHPGRDCGVKGYLSCQRTLVLARANTPDAIRDAIRRRRTSASELPDLWAALRGGSDNTWQGGTIKAAPGSTITLTVDAGSASQPLQSVDIISDAGLDPHPYYDGDNVPCSIAHCKPTGFLHDQFAPSLVKQHLRYVATGGYATKKVRHDAAPPPALVTTVPLSGHRATKTISVRVPSARSNRPDGKHFFYAVVHAAAPPGARGPGVTARAWTGPVFTTGVPGGTWIAGDTHVHTDHSPDGSSVRQGIDQGARGNVSVADQIDQAERVGLGFLALTDHRTYDQHWDPLWTSDKLVLIPGEEANGAPHANVHGAADELVDGANPPGSAEYRHIQQSIWDVHAQNASWQTNHPDDGEWNGTKPNANASAVGVDTVEAWNRASDPDGELDYVENRLNAGYRFGLTGASDNHFKELWGVAGPGMPTTYVFAPTPTERGLVAGLRAGHTSVSVNPHGPMVTLAADADGDGAYESMGGDEVTAVPGAPAALKIRVRRATGTTVFVYAAPGRSRGPVATFSPTKVDQSFTIALDPTASWYRVEVRGAGAPPGLAVATYQPNNALLAFASPLFVDQTGRAAPRAEIPLPPLSAATDSAVAAIETPGAFAGFGDIAATPNAAHVVAEVDVGGQASVSYRRMSTDGSRSLGGPELLSDPDASARFPSVAAAGNNVWVAWQDERGKQTPHRTNIAVRHSSDDGITWSKARNVTTTNHAQQPTIEVTRDNHAVAAWSDNTRGAFDVYVQELFVDKPPANVSAPGKRVERGRPADTRSAIYPASLFPSLAISNDGRLAVAWTDNRRDIDAGWTGSRAGEGTAPDDWEIFTATRSRGAAWGAPVNASNDAKRADRHPSIAFTGSQDSLVVAWDSKELQESGVNLDVRYAQSSSPVGAAWSPARRLGFNADAMSQHPQVVAAGPGARVIWYDSRSADWRWSIWSAAIDPAGAGTPVRLSGAGNGTYPSASGNLVAFTSDRRATRPQRDQTAGVYVLRH